MDLAASAAIELKRDDSAVADATRLRFLLNRGLKTTAKVRLSLRYKDFVR